MRGRKKGFKHLKKTKKKISNSLMKHTAWNKGIVGYGKLHGFKKGLIPWNKNKEFLAIRGKNNHNWKGGISDVRKQIYNSLKYKKWRSDIFTRDNWTCQTCRIRGVNLEAHHIKSKYKILKEYRIKTIQQAENCKEFWDINNGITLCKECHKLTNNYSYKDVNLG